MSDETNVANSGAQRSAGYAMLFVTLLAGMLTMPFSLKMALLPAAVLAGWVQIGGL